MIHLPSACLSIVLALALAVQAQEAQEPAATPADTTPAPPSTTPIDHTTTVEPPTTVPPTTTATPSPITTTTKPPIITTTTTALPVTKTTTTPPPVTTTTPPASITTTSKDVVPPVTRPTTNHITSISSSAILPTTSAGSNNANGGSSSSTSSTNVPAIVGGVVGVLALAVIVATSVICYKRRKRNNRELTFDTLEGMSGPALSSRKRASLNYLTSSSPVITSGNVGLNSVPSAHGGYDDNYDYEMQSNVGYPTPLQPHNNSAYHQSAYNSNAAYDGYGSPHQGYRPNPTIFQEEAPYATASSMGRDRTGFDQNLPEVMYNRGEIDHDPTAGFYQEEDIYNTAAWSQDQQHPHGGYIAEQGQWDVDAMLHQYDHEIEMPLPPTHQQVLSTPSLDSTLIGSPGRPKHQSATVHNPQAIVESPILQSATLRSGDIFGQEAAGAGASLGSPRISTKQATQELEAVGGGAGRQSASNSSSPRIINASREMRSIELASQSPTFGGPSTEAINSYATDYDQSRPSIDRTAGGAGSPSNLNANKSLRSFRREDWS
ncbi:hypothetical protein KI688_004976 [Linnemannia hyalina]|uniref:receptor protein-tyrosine kinase n=1 Tax=Linnemannia hyalina TaxID=64524 RepID=A0A9P7XKQ1_9FUNG|nr:hypothetical protein KI688_004976 [Linnemannia hyalina]